MRVVLDTNVLVSAILTPGRSAHQVLLLTLRGDLQLCVDRRIVAEYREVLARKRFGFVPDLVEDLLEALLEEALEVLPAPLPGRFPDEADRAFVEVAVAAGARVVITGNARHFGAAQKAGVLVKSPGEFLARWLRR